MAIPRLSQGADSARIAAAQAEFNEKKWVWVPDDKEGYLAGWVVREEGDDGWVVMASGGEVSCSWLSVWRRVLVLMFNIDASSAVVCTIEDEPTKVRQS